MQLPWYAVAMFNEILFAMLTQLQLPCSMKILFTMLTRIHFPCSNEVQMPCLMNCTSIGACWYANANINWKMLYCQRICWNAIAMFTEMQLPCLLKMQLLCLLKCRCHVLCNVLPLGEILVWKWRWPVENVVQLPCLVYCSCHVCCTAVSMFSVL